MKATFYGRLIIYAAVITLVVMFAARGFSQPPPRLPPEPQISEWPTTNPIENGELEHLRAQNTKLRRTLARERQRFRRALQTVIRGATYGSSLERAFLCIHSYEGSWTDPNAPFYGGVQMDLGFQRTYGGWALAAFGTADHWPVSVQLATAIRAKVSGRGFFPWPNTARYCGLL